MDPLPKVAYFCMEYGLNEELPIYGGGLGILAGDHLKEAHDLGLPLIGIGILWRKGYTYQTINAEGYPQDDFPNRDFDFLEDTGLKVSVEINGEPVWARVWLVERYHNAPLYLFDTDLPENPPTAREITAQLYGGDDARRVAQEMILGIGGVRLLRKLGFQPDIYHFNEGHAVLAGVELIREQIEQGISFQEALASARQMIVFTTHTPVPAGNESHYLSLLKQMGAYNGLTYSQLRAIGGSPFSMTVAGLRLARRSNGVSKLHAETAENMWSQVEDRSEIIAITNGVHRKTWQDPTILKSATTGPKLWEAHLQAKRQLIQEIQARQGTSLKENTLLIGFARRATAYKRADLIFQDKAVMEPLLADGKLQLVFSGKAHPNDHSGKEIVASIVEMAKQYPKAVVFLENYDMKLGRLLTRGCDVWLNNPERPQEASGTSGMKAAMNGVLNLSILDGWWPEGCEHGVNGWRIEQPEQGESSRDLDSQALYEVLLNEVIPTYYQNGDKWVRMMQASIAMASEQFSSRRMLAEYVEQMYSRLETQADRKVSQR